VPGLSRSRRDDDARPTRFAGNPATGGCPWRVSWRRSNAELGDPGAPPKGLGAFSCTPYLDPQCSKNNSVYINNLAIKKSVQPARREMAKLELGTPAHKYGVIYHMLNKITSVYYIPLSRHVILDYSMSERVCTPARRANEAILAEPIVE